MKSGNLFVIAAPSGTGKTTLVKALVESLSDISVSISHTTRPQRPGETDGINYFFINEDQFRQMIENGEFLEYARVFGRYYGTSHQWVTEALKKGIDVILEIDWQGMQQITALIPESISIFILPPSLENLKDRLVKRDQDKDHIIQERMADVQETISHVYEFDYVVVNDDFTRALHDLELIVEANRLRQKQQTQRFAKLISELSL
ncbi:MAG TPA: guanylate kinase [Gammaproteobacteria bacterium]|nr:guanylate kinase [Gammaproteobacteria bacterium]